MAITREFANGNMVVKRDGQVVREVTPAQLQTQIDRINERKTTMTTRLDARITEVTSWKTQAEASA